MSDIKKIYLQSLMVRDDIPEETQDYIESELANKENENEHRITQTEN